MNLGFIRVSKLQIYWSKINHELISLTAYIASNAPSADSKTDSYFKLLSL